MNAGKHHDDVALAAYKGEGIRVCFECRKIRVYIGVQGLHIQGEC